MALLHSISKSFGNNHVLDNFSLKLPDGHITALLGPSGCGKTTICNIIAGLVEPDKGEIKEIDKNKIRYMFQEPRLLPWYTVYRNLEIVLKRHKTAGERSLLINKILARVDLLDFKDAYPAQLSGGMAQRVALARAFVFPGNLVLMDEPFHAIDLKRKAELISYVNKVWENSQASALFVTHNIDEALLLGDDIVVLSQRPARIKLKLNNPMPRNERISRKIDLIDMEKQLYLALLDK